METWPLEISEKQDEVVLAARVIAELVGGKELAQIREGTGSTAIPKAIVGMKARLQELEALQAEQEVRERMWNSFIAGGKS